MDANRVLDLPGQPIPKPETYTPVQEEGLDTVDANRALGLPDDCREYTSVRNILADLGVRSIRLMVGLRKQGLGLGIRSGATSWPTWACAASGSWCGPRGSRQAGCAGCQTVGTYLWSGVRLTQSQSLCKSACWGRWASRWKGAPPAWCRRSSAEHCLGYAGA